MKNRIINGLRIFAPTSAEDLIHFAFEEKKILVAVNAEKILNPNVEMRNVINRNCGYPDGIGAVWALEKKGIKEVNKVAGCELWLEIIRTYNSSKTFYLIGGTEEVIAATVQRLKYDFPDMQILNYRNGYINSRKEKQDLIEDISQMKPDVIFVAMGSPKQELLMEEMYKEHPAVYQGLGGSFDVYTGNIQRAPKWWIDNNLEWAYRLVKQPKRIFRQMVYLEFFLKLKMNKF